MDSLILLLYLLALAGCVALGMGNVIVRLSSAKQRRKWRALKAWLAEAALRR